MPILMQRKLSFWMYDFRNRSGHMRPTIRLVQHALRGSFLGAKPTGDPGIICIFLGFILTDYLLTIAWVQSSGSPAEHRPIGNAALAAAVYLLEGGIGWKLHCIGAGKLAPRGEKLA